MLYLRGINAYSIWDLKWRPQADPRGMACIYDIRNPIKGSPSTWVDIYLLNKDHSIYGSSKSNAIIAAGAPANEAGRALPLIPEMDNGNGSFRYSTLNWWEANTIAVSHGKRLLSNAEFHAYTKGVTEETDASAVDNGTTQHISDLMSKFGIEGATGLQWVWGLENGVNRDFSSTYGWQDNTGGHGKTYAPSYFSVTAVLLGGFREDGMGAGSRSNRWYSCVHFIGWSIGARLACDHLSPA